MNNYILKTKGDVPNEAYKGNKDIVGVFVSRDTKIIGREAFEGCSNIETIAFEEGSSLEKIEAWAFAACEKITRIDFPDNEIEIEAKAFYKCDSIAHLTFGKKILTIHYDAFSTGAQLKSVCISSEALDFHTGLDYMPNDKLSNHIDLCWLMLHCDRNKSFDSGLSLGTLLDMAIKECVALGELHENATMEEIHGVFSKYHSVTVQKEFAPATSSHFIDRKWMVFPEDHFYTRMAHAIFSNYAFCRKDLRKNRIALLLDRKQEYSQADFDKVIEYANIVGYPLEVLKPIGRMQLGWDEDDGPETWDDVPGCEYEKDDAFDEVGILYEDMISGKVYAMSSDYHIQNEGMFMMLYSHFLEEMKAIDPKDLYNEHYQLQSNDIEFKEIAYLKIYQTLE